MVFRKYQTRFKEDILDHQDEFSHNTGRTTVIHENGQLLEQVFAIIASVSQPSQDLMKKKNKK